MSKAEKLKRYIIIFGGCILMIIGILWRQQVVTKNRQKKIASVLNEWNKKGKPVKVQKIDKQTINVYKKFTVQSAKGSEYEGYVTRNIWERVEFGQKVEVLLGEGKRFGEISYRSEKIDSRSGMYILRVKFDSLLPAESDLPVYRVLVNVYENVISIPSEVIFESNGIEHVWIVYGNGLAFKRSIVVDVKSDYGAIITSGLTVGDLLITNGYTVLKENDRVNILNQEEVK